MTECDFIADAARDPTVLGNPRDSRETHAGGPAHNFENRRYRLDAVDRGNISLKVVSHRDPPISYRQWLGRAGMTPQTRRNPQMASQVAVGEGDRQIRLFDLLV
jgi:hypothetical protein